jgi:rhamnulokinase
MTMRAAQRFLAFDLGASSGRAIVGEFDGARVRCRELTRFANEPVQVRGDLHWDVLGLFREIKRGLSEYARRYGSAPNGIGIDTWGVDFGLFDRDGRLLGNPHHYRDRRTQGLLEEIDERVGRYRIYRATGVNPLEIHTICQLYALARRHSPQLEVADRLLMMPSVFHYFLTGEKSDEHSSISNTGFYGFECGAAVTEFLERLGIPVRIVPPVAPPGTVIGGLQRGVQDESGLGAVPVIAVASHDTASAVLSVPADNRKHWAYLSSGTWSVLGVESERPIVTQEGFDCGLTNAATAGGNYMAFFGITGLWILQECARVWAAYGGPSLPADMVRLAACASPFAGFVEVDDPSFVNPTDMPRALVTYLQRTSQQVPTDNGTLIRIVLESLALKYRHLLAKLEKITGNRVEVLHVVGGGTGNELLIQFTANATGLPMLAGPAEATALGNVLLQMIGAGAIPSVCEGRALVRSSVELREYEPRDRERWDCAYKRFLGVVSEG